MHHQKTIGDTTYTYDDQFYILRMQTKFNSGYQEAKNFYLAKIPRSDTDYYVKEEISAFSDPEAANEGGMHTVTTIVNENTYTVFVNKYDSYQDSREVVNFPGTPPKANQLPQEYR